MIEYWQLGVTATLGTIGTLVPLRKAEKLSTGGYVFVALAIVAFVLSIVQVALAQRERDAERFAFSPAQIFVEMDASYDAPMQADASILATAPSAFGIQEASLNSRPLAFILTAVPEIKRPSRSRTFTSGHVVYFSDKMRYEYPTWPGPDPKLLWDLNGDTLAFRVPVAKFKDVIPDRHWSQRVTITFAGNAFNTWADERGLVSVILGGLDEKQIRRRLAR
jgi:hypothetical protein